MSPATGVPVRLVVIDVISTAKPVIENTSQLSVFVEGVAHAVTVTTLFVTLLLVNVSVVALPTNVSVAQGIVTVFAHTVTVQVLNTGAELNVCTQVNVFAASVLAMVADVDGNVITVESVPESVNVLFIVAVLPSAIVRVADVAGEVIVTLFTDVAVATHNAGVVKLGDTNAAFSASTSSSAVCTVVEEIFHAGLNETAEAVVQPIQAACGRLDTVL